MLGDHRRSVSQGLGFEIGKAKVLEYHRDISQICICSDGRQLR
jgi:hypothetical protein